MDATANEVSGVRVQSYPTLQYYGPGKKAGASGKKFEVGLIAHSDSYWIFVLPRHSHSAPSWLSYMLAVFHSLSHCDGVAQQGGRELADLVAWVNEKLAKPADADPKPKAKKSQEEL